MPSLLIVDDEPQARRYLSALIARHCPDFEVVGEAEDGAEALEAAARLAPDLVLTDVRMPGMDGLELARRLRDGFPATYVVVASGHEEFEYARSALKAGVVDYLLKPVKAEQLKAVLGGVGERVASGLYRRRVALLRDIAGGAAPGASGDQARLLPAGRYSVAVLRFGPPPSRFAAAAEEPALAQPALAGLRARDIWSLPGRDERELAFARSNELTDGGEFEVAVLAAAAGSGRAYRSLALGCELFPLDELGAKIAALCRAIDASAVPGRERILRGSSEARDQRSPDARLTEVKDLEGRMEYLLSDSRYSELERLVRELFMSWEAEERPLVQASSQLRRLLELVRRRSAGEARLRDEELDALVEEASATAADYGELAEAAIDAIDSIARRPARSGGKEDVPAFFSSIKLHVEGSFALDISLQSTCKAFSISQTYLSRLFRRHEGVSFNDYLTGVRIAAAKRLMDESPEMPLKEVAALVGYQDQFYFSRVFKSAAGLPPSEYAQSKKRGPC